MLVQRLRRWPNIEPASGGVCWAAIQPLMVMRMTIILCGADKAAGNVCVVLRERGIKGGKACDVKTEILRVLAKDKQAIQKEKKQTRQPTPLNHWIYWQPVSEATLPNQYVNSTRTPCMADPDTVLGIPHPAATLHIWVDPESGLISPWVFQDGDNLYKKDERLNIKEHFNCSQVILIVGADSY